MELKPRRQGNYHHNGRRQRGLRKCPFCGAKVAHCATVAAIELMDDDYPDYEWAKDHYAVVCNYNAGGCGAMTRGYMTEEAAVMAWNRRCRDGKENRV